MDDGSRFSPPVKAAERKALLKLIDPDLLLDFLAEQEVPATFSVIPAAGGEPVDRNPEWKALLHRALDEGQELQPHSFDHVCTFEFGVPPSFILDTIPEAKARWELDPDIIQAALTLENLSDRIARGKER